MIFGFRLGGYLGKCIGTAWFSEFTFEEGVTTKSNEWKYACFIFKNTDVMIDSQEVKISVTDNDISDIKDTIGRFEQNIRSLSNNKMSADCDVYVVDDPIKKLTYDDEFAYYVAAEDIEDSIKNVIQESDYDHIFAIIKLGNEKYKDTIEINDWIGLRRYGLLWNRIF